jgi:cytochrome b involved in lipid metabolism
MHRASPFIEVIPNGVSMNVSCTNASKAVGSKLERHQSKKKLVQITIEEVEAANTAEKPWVAIRDKVYDLTAFVEKHPGGKDFLLAAVGRDATSVYESIHTDKNSRVLK